MSRDGNAHHRSRPGHGPQSLLYPYLLILEQLPSWMSMRRQTKATYCHSSLLMINSPLNLMDILELSYNGNLALNWTAYFQDTAHAINRPRFGALECHSHCVVPLLAVGSGIGTGPPGESAVRAVKTSTPSSVISNVCSESHVSRGASLWVYRWLAYRIEPCVFRLSSCSSSCLAMLHHDTCRVQSWVRW